MAYVVYELSKYIDFTNHINACNLRALTINYYHLLMSYFSWSSTRYKGRRTIKAYDAQSTQMKLMQINTRKEEASAQSVSFFGYNGWSRERGSYFAFQQLGHFVHCYSMVRHLGVFDGYSGK
jgi:hypothetical protein